MPTGSIKKKVPSWREFNLLLETADLDDSIGHLFLVDIFFDYKKATQEQDIQWNIPAYNWTTKNIRSEWTLSLSINWIIFRDR